MTTKSSAAPTKLTVGLGELFFDPNNPRLPPGLGDDPDKIFRYLITDIGVDDLLESISASGLITADPVIVKARKAGGYFVIEGNRRLAAMKLLNGEGPDDGIPLPNVPKIPASIARTFKTIEVQTDWLEESLQSYLGYKHVTAAREWPPEAKARFVFEHAKGDLSPDNLRRFAKTLGTNYATLKRWLLAFLTLKEANKMKVFDPDDTPTKRYFGTFYTLLGGQQAQNFLGLHSERIQEQPVPKARTKELGEFVQWTIGTKDRPAVVNSRQQRQFEQILASPTALKHFRVKTDLETSLLYTEYNSEEIAAKFRAATYSIEETLTKLFDVRERKEVKESFDGLERAYKKAKHNMTSDQVAEHQ